MALPEVRISFPDRAALQRELDQNLRHGRAFSNQASDVPVLSECVIVLVHPEHGEELRLPAQVVMVNQSGPMYGIGLALRSFGQDEIARVQEFTSSTGKPTLELGDALDPHGQQLQQLIEESPAVSDAPLQLIEESPAADVVQPMAANDIAPDAGVQPADAEPDESHTELDTETAALLAADTDDDDFPIDEERELTFDDADDQPHATELQSFNKQAKLRHLNAAQQLKVARTGELAERIAVERLYGKQVWDALLHNPRLSTPEVARIARKGTVPKPLLEVILENGAWLKADAVRRALLSNPKLSPDAVLKLLRITPKHELKMMEKGTAYGMQVRDAARKLLKQ